MPHTLTIPPEARDDAVLIARGEYNVALNPPPKTILDLGGNVGLFSAWAAQQWPGAEITAYEPWAENAQAFRDNLAPFPRVKLIKSAVRARAGSCDMHEDRNAMCHTFRADGTGAVRSVYCVAAGSLPSAELVKIDIEGDEAEVLPELDLSRTRAVVVEAHSYAIGDKLVNYMCSRDFVMHERKNTLNGCCLIKFLRRSELTGTQKLLIAVPTYGVSPTSFWECLMRLVQEPPCSIAVRTLAGDSLVSRARNTLTADFLKTDCTDILFIDSDLLFSPEHVARIISHDEDVVGGFYPKKQDGQLQWVCNAALHNPPPREDGLQEVRYMGTGFLRVRRSVFERMIEAYGEQIKYAPDSAQDTTEHDFWSVGVYKFPHDYRRYLSEDWYFCQRWLDLGGKVWGDTRLLLKHVGPVAFPLQSQRDQISNPKV